MATTPKFKRRVTTDYVAFPEGRSRLGDVYFISCANRFVKVGFTDDVEMRLAELQTASPFELKLIGLLHNTGMLAEKWFHNALRQHHERGEWFELTDRIRMLVHYVSRGFYPMRAAEVVALYEGLDSPGVTEIVERYCRDRTGEAYVEPSDTLLDILDRVRSRR